MEVDYFIPRSLYVMTLKRAWEHIQEGTLNSQMKEKIIIYII